MRVAAEALPEAALLVDAWSALPSRLERGLCVAIGVAAVGVQLLASVFWYELEICQGAGFPLGQRAVNVVAVATGRFEAWGLGCPWLSERYLAPNFAPFLTARHLGSGMGWALRAGWILGALTVVALTARLAGRLRRLAR